MQNYENTQILRKCFNFSLEIMDFHDELIDQKKTPIAKRLLKSTLLGTCALQKSFEADRQSDYRNDISLALTSIKNVIYWLDQCEKSGYLNSKKLINKAYELQNFCESKSEILS